MPKAPIRKKSSEFYTVVVDVTFSAIVEIEGVKNNDLAVERALTLDLPYLVKHRRSSLGGTSITVPRHAVQKHVRAAR